MIQLLQLRCQSQLRGLRRVVGGLFFGGLGAAAFFQLGTLGDGQRAWHGEHEDQKFSPKRTWGGAGFLKESYILSPLEQDAIADSEMFADHFGAAIATEGDRLLIGATRDCRGGSNHGWVHRFGFEEEVDRWVLKGDVSPVKRSPNSYFGKGLAIHEGLLFVGAYGCKESHQAMNVGKVVAFVERGGDWVQSGDVVAPEMPSYALLNDSRNLRQRAFGESLSVDGDWLAIHADEEVSITPKKGPLYLYRHGSGGMSEFQQRLPEGDPSLFPRVFAKQFELKNGQLAVASLGGAHGAPIQYDLYGFDEGKDLWVLSDQIDDPEEAKSGSFVPGERDGPVLFTVDGFLLWGDENGDWCQWKLGTAKGYSRSQHVFFSREYGLAYSVKTKQDGENWHFVVYHPMGSDGRLNSNPLFLAPSLHHRRGLSDIVIADNGDVMVGQREVATGEFECGGVFVWRRRDLLSAEY